MNADQEGSLNPRWMLRWLIGLFRSHYCRFYSLTRFIGLARKATSVLICRTKLGQLVPHPQSPYLGSLPIYLLWQVLLLAWLKDAVQQGSCSVSCNLWCIFILCKMDTSEIAGLPSMTPVGCRNRGNHLSIPSTATSSFCSLSWYSPLQQVIWLRIPRLPTSTNLAATHPDTRQGHPEPTIFLGRPCRSTQIPKHSPRWPNWSWKYWALGRVPMAGPHG